MAWNTEETQRRLREAALAEFAEVGYAAASMTRIATRAGINKERLYNYFGDKRGVWEAVLLDQMDHIVDAVSPQVDIADIGAYAAALYDFHRLHPTLLRLLQWEGLSGEPPVARVRRGEKYGRAVTRLEQAQREGRLSDRLDAPHLLFTLIALAAFWQAVPQLAELVTGHRDDVDARREFVRHAAERLALPDG